MIAFGFFASISATGMVLRDDLAVDPGLADAAGDELGVLRAEVDDKNDVRGVAVGGGGGC